jgi:hypothetical protein
MMLISCGERQMSAVTASLDRRRVYEIAQRNIIPAIKECYSDKSNLVNTFKQVKYSKNCCSVA